MTKREVLIEICENPGWEPPHHGNGVERHIDELQHEGWIITRLDGFTATSKALEGYPYFAEQADIAEIRPQPEAEERACIPRGIVVAFVAGVLDELPLPKVLAIAHRAARKVSAEAQVAPEWEVATHIVERLT